MVEVVVSFTSANRDEELFTEGLARMGRLEYDGRPAFLRSNLQRGVKRLPVRWSRPAELNS